MFTSERVKPKMIDLNDVAVVLVIIALIMFIVRG